MIHRFIVTALSSILCLLGTSTHCSAQPVSPIDFAHATLAEADLPSPGKPVILSVMMKKDVIGVGMKVRALVTRDGKLMEIQDAEPDLDAQDRAVFKFEFPAPLAELSYQFLFNDKLGQSSSSKRYVARRACIPHVEITEIQKKDGAVVTRDDVGILVAQARGLERDIDLYERTIKLLNDIQTAIDRK